MNSREAAKTALTITMDSPREELESFLMGLDTVTLALVRGVLGQAADTVRKIHSDRVQFPAS